MARLNAADRRALPKSDFAVPSKAPGPGSYPVNDKAHARAAKSMAHNAPPSERKAIDAKADAMLGTMKTCSKCGKRSKSAYGPGCGKKM